MPLLAKKRYQPNHAGLYVPAGSGLGLQTNLSSFFSLDNTLADATGAVTDLTNNNTVTFVSPPSSLPAVTNCANFVSASSQYLSHADATGLNVVGVDFSIQLWVYPTDNTRTFLTKNSGAFGSREFRVSYTFGSGATNPIQSVVGDYSSLTTSNYSTNAWHHVVLTFNNTSKATVLYVDGASAATSTGSGTGPGGTSDFRVGASGDLAQYMSGNICLVGVWKSRILSAGEVTQLYNSGNGLSYAAMA